MAIKTITKTATLVRNRVTSSADGIAKLSIGAYENYYVSKITASINCNGNSAISNSKAYIYADDGTEIYLGTIQTGDGATITKVFTKTFTLKPTSAGVALSVSGFASSNTIKIHSTEGVTLINEIKITVEYEKGYKFWTQAPVLSVNSGYATSNSTILFWTAPSQSDSTYTTWPVEAYEIQRQLVSKTLQQPYVTIATIASKTYTDNIALPNQIGSITYNYKINAIPQTIGGYETSGVSSNIIITRKERTAGSIQYFYIDGNPTQLYLNQAYTLFWEIKNGTNNALRMYQITAFNTNGDALVLEAGSNLSYNNFISITPTEQWASSNVIRIEAWFDYGESEQFINLNVIKYTPVTNPTNGRIENYKTNILLPSNAKNVTISWDAGQNGTLNNIIGYKLEALLPALDENHDDVLKTLAQQINGYSYVFNLNDFYLANYSDDLQFNQIKFILTSIPTQSSFGPESGYEIPASIIIEDDSNYNISISKYFSDQQFLGGQLQYSILYDNVNSNQLNCVIKSKTTSFVDNLGNTILLDNVTLPGALLNIKVDYTLEFASWSENNGAKIKDTKPYSKTFEKRYYIKSVDNYFDELYLTAKANGISNSFNNSSIVTAYSTDFIIQLRFPSDSDPLGLDFNYQLTTTIAQERSIIPLANSFSFDSSSANLDERLLNILNSETIVTFNLQAIDEDNQIYSINKFIRIIKIKQPTLSDYKLENKQLSFTINGTTGYFLNNEIKPIGYKLSYYIFIPEKNNNQWEWTYHTLEPVAVEELNELILEQNSSSYKINLGSIYPKIVQKLFPNNSDPLPEVFSVPIKVSMSIYCKTDTSADASCVFISNDFENDIKNAMIPEIEPVYINESSQLQGQNIFFYYGSNKINYNSNLIVNRVHDNLLIYNTTSDSFTDNQLILFNETDAYEKFTYNIKKSIPKLIIQDGNFVIEPEGIILSSEYSNIYVIRYKHTEDIIFNLTVSQINGTSYLNGTIKIPELASGGYYNEYNVNGIQLNYKLQDSINYSPIINLDSLTRSQGYITIEVNNISLGQLSTQVCNLIFQFIYNYGGSDTYTQEILRPFFRIDNDLSIRRNRIGINVLAEFEPGASENYDWKNNSTLEIMPHPISGENNAAVVNITLGDYKKFIEFKTSNGESIGNIGITLDNKLSIAGFEPNLDELFEKEEISVQDTDYTLNKYNIAGLKVYHGSNEALQAYTFQSSSNNTKVCLQADYVLGGVYNDYAEFRATSDEKEAGRCVIEVGDGTLERSYVRLQPGANIISDTYGFAIGQTEINHTPIAVSGRVLAYPYEKQYDFLPGDAVCSGPNGTVSRMTREEIIQYPERIIGTVSEIPSYDIWGPNNIPVKGRIWIKIK